MRSGGGSTGVLRKCDRKTQVATGDSRILSGAMAEEAAQAVAEQDHGPAIHLCSSRRINSGEKNTVPE